jgi:hypothetical protein
VIKILPSFLVVSQSKYGRLVFDNPLRTEKRSVPTQVILGKAIKTVEAAAINSKDAFQGVVIGNLLMSVVLKGVLGAIYTMVNTLQIMTSYCLLIVPMPANVTLVMTQIKLIASFDYLPTE